MLGRYLHVLSMASLLLPMEYQEVKPRTKRVAQTVRAPGHVATIFASSCHIPRDFDPSEDEIRCSAWIRVSRLGIGSFLDSFEGDNLCVQ